MPIYADADFCIVGHVDPAAPQEARKGRSAIIWATTAWPTTFRCCASSTSITAKDAVWPFTVVGRPPQEDTTFGQLIHELTGAVIPTVMPGVKAVHAVDAAGVHPLLLAIGSERYMPFLANPRPQELLTQASAILGQGQLSLAKFLLIVNRYDDEPLDIHDIPAFFRHVLARVDWRRDLHFHTSTTIDTLDYSGDGLNMGSKVVIAAAGPPIRDAGDRVAERPAAAGGISASRGWRCRGCWSSKVQSRKVRSRGDDTRPCDLRTCEPCDSISAHCHRRRRDFTARNLSNFLWVTFTRTNPAADIYGVGAFTDRKHWGCTGPLVIDARIKPHHAPPLVEDPEVGKRIDALAARGGPLARWL